MLNPEWQRKLAERYGGQALVKKAFDQSLVEGFKVEFAEEREEYAAVVMVDIAGFSNVVAGFSAVDVRKYLDCFYAEVMPVLYSQGGMIDRVAGDGVLAVFSPFFTKADRETTDRNAMQAAEMIVAALSGSDCAAKAAVSSGSLFFCKTGVAAVYEEHTVIGEPITVAYRIEEIACEDQVVIQAAPRFVRIIDGQLAARSALERVGFSLPAVRWQVELVTHTLRGLGDVDVIVQRLS